MLYDVAAVLYTIWGMLTLWDLAACCLYGAFLHRWAVISVPMLALVPAIVGGYQVLAAIDRAMQPKRYGVLSANTIYKILGGKMAKRNSPEMAENRRMVKIIGENIRYMRRQRGMRATAWKPWTEEEVGVIVRARREGASISAAARSIGRTVNGASSVLERLGE